MGKKILIGCGVTAFLGVLGIIGAIVFIGPKLFEWMNEQIAEEQKRQQLVDGWQPPAKESGPEILFPAEVGVARLRSQDEKAAIPVLKIDLKGRHAVYRVGAHDVDLFVYQVTNLEKEALFRRVEDVYRDDEEGYKRLTKMGYRCYYGSSKHHQNHLWFLKGWLFIFRSDAGEDQEPFVKDYLTALGQPQPEAR
jgi:hypothetical protein